MNITESVNGRYSIQCIYLPESTAKGCVYTLVSGMNGTENVTGYIDRESLAVILAVDIGCYSEVSAYINSTGVRDLAVQAPIVTTEECG